MEGRLPVVAAGVLLLLGAACRPTDACGETGVACGGDPTGRWRLVDLADACQDPTYKPPLQRTYLDQTVTTARTPPPEPTSSDWCADLEYGPNGITNLLLPHDTFSLAGAFVSYGSDGSYSAFITSKGAASIELSASCLTRFGTSTDCTKVSADLAAFTATMPGFTNASCAPSSNGCLCSYSIESDATGPNLAGKWSTRGNLLTHFAGSKVLPSQVDFCADGDHLTLWGHDRTAIMDFGGLRTLGLQRIVCGNSMVERGEQCDPPDGTTCNADCQTIVP